MRKLTMAVVLLALSVACASETEFAEQQPPLGLWVFAVDGGAHDHTLTVTTDSDRWQAAVDGRQTTINMDADTLTVAGPDGQVFVGQLSGDGDRIDGHWTQPANQYAYSRMVTKMTLTRVSAGHWRGDVAVQPRPFTVFLDIFETDENTVEAVIRNPERNEILASRYALEADGDQSWFLRVGPDDDPFRIRLEQTGIAKLVLSHPWFDDPITLRPAHRRDAERYFSRPRQATSARFTRPVQTDDGWDVIDAGNSSYDTAKLDELVNALANDDPRSARPRMVHSMLVAHRGRLLLEEYFYDHDRDTRHDTRSLAKVFGPLLVGALRLNGDAIDPDQRTVARVLDDAGEPLDDPRKANITLGQLMSYTSGLDCDAATSTSLGMEDAMWSQDEEPDFWRYTARLPLLYDPGTRYAYCSGSINMAAAEITATSGKTLYETFDQLFAIPMNFGAYHWNLAPNGAAYLGGGVYMRPRDILKLGVLYTSGGVWQGEQLLSEDWIAESTESRMAISPATTQLSEENFYNNYFGGEQAYVWRRDTVQTEDRDYASYEATGNGGQILLVVPELELTVVFTGGNYRWGSIWGRWRNELVGAYVIPALGESP
ncbi:MAG: serine hydrolase [Pseudomonadota bacterium]